MLDKSPHEPLPGVNVAVEGTTLGTVTDANGAFELSNLPPQTYRLRLSMIGYRTERLRAIALQQDAVVDLGVVEILARRPGQLRPFSRRQVLVRFHADPWGKLGILRNGLVRQRIGEHEGFSAQRPTPLAARSSATGQESGGRWAGKRRAQLAITLPNRF